MKDTRHRTIDQSTGFAHPPSITRGGYGHQLFMGWPLFALAGLPLATMPVDVAAMSDQELRYLGLFCTTHPGMVELAQTVERINITYFDSSEAPSAVGETRVCFRDGYYFNFSSISLGPSNIAPAVFSLSPSVSTVTYLVEGDNENAPYTLSVTRGGNIYNDSSLKYDITGTATAGGDYHFSADSDAQQTSGQFDFPAWDVTKRQIVIDISDDSEEEDDETIEVSFHSASAVGGEAASWIRPITLVILDDDRQKTLLRLNHGCIQYEQPLEIFGSGSSIYSAQFGSSITSINFVGGENSSRADTACGSGDGYYIWPGLYINSANAAVNYPNIQSNSISASINDYLKDAPAPVIDRIDDGDGSVSIHFSAVENPIGYTATCLPAGGGDAIIAHGVASPIQVTGLTNGQDYSCSLTHFGVSDASPTALARPRAATTPTSIITLSQWTLALLSLLLGLIGVNWRNTRRSVGGNA